MSRHNASILPMRDSIIPDHYLNDIEENKSLSEFIDVFKARLISTLSALNCAVDPLKIDLNLFCKPGGYSKIKSKFCLNIELWAELSEMSIAKIDIEENLPRYLPIRPEDRFDFGGSFGLLGSECIINDRLKITIFFDTAYTYKKADLTELSIKVSRIINTYHPIYDIDFNYIQGDDQFLLGEFKLN